MSQDHSNLGYYNTYFGDAAYTTNDHQDNFPPNSQFSHMSSQPWSQLPVVALTEAQWRMQTQYQWPNSDAWCDQDILSPSDLTSETSGHDSNIPPGLNMACSRSESAEYSDPWEQEPPSVPLSSPSYPIGVPNELLSNIGSNFGPDCAIIRPLQIPTCVSTTPDETIQQYEYMLETQVAKEPVPEEPSCVLPNIRMADSSPVETTMQACQPQTPSSIITPATQQKKVRQVRPNIAPTAKTMRENTTKQRLFCEACRDSKDYSRGFRGEHELARHWAQKHSNCREAWVCVDLTPDQKLRNCERCKTGHTYGTSYGGAEHFRRKHTKIFGDDMVEWLRGKNKRRALSGGRLIEEGWLRRVSVDGGGEPSMQQEQPQSSLTTRASGDGEAQGILPDNTIRLAHLQPFQQMQPPMHGTQAWVQLQYQQYQGQMLQQHQVQHQPGRQQRQQQPSWYPGIF